MAYVGAELQDKYARYGWNLPVQDLLATGLHGTDLLLSPASRAERTRIEATLRACGLQRLAHRRFLSLSYGQKRLALLARALVAAPDWLLLDEFYNGLDPRFRRRIDRVLAAARAAGQLLDRDGASRLRHPARHARHHRAARGTGTFGSGARPHGSRPIDPPGRGSHCARRARSRPAPATGGENPRPRAAHVAERPVLLRLSRANLYVDYRPVLRDLDWELRKGEHWAVFGAERSRQNELSEIALRRSCAGNRRRHRAHGVSAGNAHRRVETACGLRITGVAKPTMRLT